MLHACCHKMFASILYIFTGKWLLFRAVISEEGSWAPSVYNSAFPTPHQRSPIILCDFFINVLQNSFSPLTLSKRTSGCAPATPKLRITVVWKQSPQLRKIFAFLDQCPFFCYRDLEGAISKICYFIKELCYIYKIGDAYSFLLHWKEDLFEKVFHKFNLIWS